MLVSVEACRCDHCLHVWLRENGLTLPTRCPNRSCRSTDWNERQQTKARLVTVYVIGKDKAGPLKIGFATNVSRRLKDIQGHNPERVACYYSITLESRAHAVLIEQKTHAALARHRLSGEWFNVSLEVAESAIKQAIARNGLTPSVTIPTTTLEHCNPTHPTAVDNLVSWLSSEPDPRQHQNTLGFIEALKAVAHNDEPPAHVRLQLARIFKLMECCPWQLIPRITEPGWYPAQVWPADLHALVSAAQLSRDNDLDLLCKCVCDKWFAGSSRRRFCTSDCKRNWQAKQRKTPEGRSYRRQYMRQLRAITKSRAKPKRHTHKKQIDLLNKRLGI